MRASSRGREGRSLWLVFSHQGLQKALQKRLFWSVTLVLWRICKIQSDSLRVADSGGCLPGRSARALSQAWGQASRIFLASSWGGTGLHVCARPLVFRDILAESLPCGATS